MFPNFFFSVWLSWMCPWREPPTTDAAEILPVKVFLIINAGPPRWQYSRLPVDGHHISLTHCHELFSQNMLTLAYTQTHACTQTRTCKSAHVEEAWNPQRTYGGKCAHLPNKIWPLYMHTHTHTRARSHNMLTNDASKAQAICSIYHVGKHTETQYLSKNVHAQTYKQKQACTPTHFHVPSVCYLTHYTHIHTLHQTHNGSPSTHRPFAVFLLFSVFRPAVSRLSVCSVARQTAPPPPNNKICL